MFREASCKVPLPSPAYPEIVVEHGAAIQHGCGARITRRRVGKPGIDRPRRSALTCLRDHLLDARHQLRDVIGDAILDGPLHAAGVHLLAVADLFNAARVEHLQVLQRIAVDHNQVGGEPGAHAPQFLLLPEDFGVIAGVLLDDLDGVEPRLLGEFPAANQAEAVHLIDEAGIVAHADQAAAAVELAQRGHPEAVVFLPEHLVGGGPAQKVGAVVGGVRPEILFQHGVQILGEPGLVLRALQVAAGPVDIQGRYPGDVRLHHAVEHLAEAFRVGLAPQVAGVAEPVGLVVVVVSGGKALYAAFDGRVRDAVPVLDAGSAEFNVVPGVGLFDAGVVGDAQSHFVRLVLHGAHGVAIDAEDLDAVDALLFERLHARPGFGGIARAPEHGIDENARRSEFSLGALPADFERPFGVAAHIADGGDAAGQPDVEFVFQRLRLAAALLLQVGMRVDQAGQNVFARGVDYGIGLHRRARPDAGTGDRVQRDDVGDQIVLDDDILGAAGRRPIAIDHGGVVDQQAAHAFAAGRRLRHGRAGGTERDKDRQGSGHGNDCGTLQAGEQHVKVINGGLLKFFGARSSVG